MSDVSPPLRVLFAGTPEIALFSLDRLLAEQGGAWQVVGVLTNPDRPRGRGRRLQPTPVKARAVEAALPILQPARLDAEARAAVAGLRPDLLVVVAYGRIFGPKFLALFPRGGVNVHPSLLPLHRGPSPLQAAILAGDDQTGVTVQYLAREMDAGDIIVQERVPLDAETTVAQLHDTLGRRGAELLADSVRKIAEGTVDAHPQDHERATYCTKIDRDAGSLTWTEGAEEIARMVRALTPWPGVRCRWGDVEVIMTDAAPMGYRHGVAQRSRPDEDTPGRADVVETVGDEARADAPVPGTVVAVDNRFGILVQTNDGLLAVRRLKLQARKELDFRSFVNGNPEIVGAVLTQA